MPAALAAILVLAGCGSPDVTNSAGQPVATESGSSNPPVAVATPNVPADLQAQLPPCPASQDLPAVPGGLPAVALACLGPGDPVLLSGLRGSPLIVNAWASWCQPCRQELPALASFAEQHPEVAVLGLNVADDPAAAAALWADLAITFPSVTDPGSTTRGALTWVGLPVSYFIGADGVIMGRHAGAVTSAEQWQSLASQFLGNLSVAAP